MDETFTGSRLQLMEVVDVWQIDLDDASIPVALLDKILSVAERERAARFRFERDAFRFKHCRAMLRMGLGCYLETPPWKIELATRRYGKPYFPEAPALHFNVTHCRGLALIAFTEVGEVGIDVEAIDRPVEALDIAKTHFCQRERDLIAAAPDSETQAEKFFSFWTRKEAVLKAAGCGLQGGLGNLDVSDDPTLVSFLSETERSEPSLWRLQDLEMRKGYKAAIAAPPGNWIVRQTPIRFESLLCCSSLLD